ncbi:transglutaminase family protein [Amycolatopsis aidingensis]|uniref:transglutaminase family protein n=1 Tax=Amycolatopsis aidingensis TaxID=2842453 RepID=UPI001C0B28D5|nr:transglutaminase domain-containing protein [Amycolatopsis aidingensis]
MRPRSAGRRGRAGGYRSAATAAELLLCVTMTVAGGLLYGRFFATTGYLPQVCGAAVAAVLAATLAGLRRWGSIGTLLTAVGGFALLSAYGVFRNTVVHGLPTGGTLAELAQGLLGGWARMFTVVPPADLRGDLLITPVLVTWIAAFTGATLVLRTRTVLAPVAPGLVAFTAALLFVGAQPGVQLWPTGFFLASALLLVLLRAARSDAGLRSADRQVPGVVRSLRRATVGRLVAGVPSIAVIILLAVLGGQAFPLSSGTDRFDPRALTEPPVRIADTLTPLVTVKTQLRERPPRRLFTVRTADGAELDRVRTAALGEFDGVLWTAADRFLLAGRELAVDPELTESRTVTAEITIDRLTGPFLPVFGWPARLRPAGLDPDAIGFSKDSGVLVNAGQAWHGAGYRLTGLVGVRDRGLPQAAPSTGPAYRRYTELPGLPSELRATARRLTASERNPYAKLVAIERYLRGLPYRLDAQPGHSYARVHNLLTGSGPDGKAGFAEQHASAFAVLARAAGFPARVAVGYRLPEARNGVHTVTTRDVHAWAEVHFERYGWIPFEPTGPAGVGTDQGGDPEDEPAGAAGSPRPDPPLAAQPRPEPPPAPAHPSPGTNWTWLRWGAALPPALALLAAAAIVLVKVRRRRRRRGAAGNVAGTLGAWQEAVDRLAERGVREAPARTAVETAAAARAALGPQAEPAVELATLATAATYAPAAPADGDVRRAWQLESELRARLYPRRPSARWLLAAVDPRPLLPRRPGTGRRTGNVGTADKQVVT